MTDYAAVRRRIVARWPVAGPPLQVGILRICVYLASARHPQQAVLDLIADDGDVAAVERVLGAVVETCPAELADLRALLVESLAPPEPPSSPPCGGNSSRAEPLAASRTHDRPGAWTPSTPPDAVAARGLVSSSQPGRRGLPARSANRGSRSNRRKIYGKREH
jgi:hypothetical protein